MSHDVKQRSKTVHLRRNISLASIQQHQINSIMTDSHLNDKKFLINNIQNSVPDFITGLLYSNPNLVKIEGYNAVIRKDIEDVKNNQVTLLSGKLHDLTEHFCRINSYSIV